MNTSVETRAWIVFAAVLLVAAAGAGAWYVLAESEYRTFEIRTQDPVSGLIADAPVELHGVEVGKVKRVELTDPRTVSILLSVRKDAPVTTATVATITGRGLATRGFTGYVYVSLENTGTDARPLAAPAGSAYPVIPAAASRSMNLDTAISQLNGNVQFMTDLLRSVLDPQTVTSLKQSLDGLQQVTGTLAANNEKLATIVANAERASARFEPLLQRSDDAVRRLDELAGTQFRPLLESSNDTIRALQMQLLPETYRTLARLDDLSRSLSDVTTKIKRDPSLVLRGSGVPPPGPGETN